MAWYTGAILIIVMMAPEAYEAQPAPARERTSTSGTPSDAAGRPQGQLPQRWPYTSRAAQERAAAARRGAAAGAESTGSTAESEDNSSQSGERREHNEEVCLARAAQSKVL